jgi:hypothetical protein
MPDSRTYAGVLDRYQETWKATPKGVIYAILKGNRRALLDVAKAAESVADRLSQHGALQDIESLHAEYIDALREAASTVRAEANGSRARSGVRKSRALRETEVMQNVVRVHRKLRAAVSAE